MCGIYGYFDARGQELAPQDLQRMAASLAHRGPDGHGLLHDRERAAAVGNQRLAIIDPAHGHQPFVSDDGEIAVVQNGAIFNFKELASELKAAGIECRTECDTEVLLRLYESEKISFISRLNGMFAIAILDRREDCIYLARDRVGEKPLYYSYENNRLVFGSEIKAILAASRPDVSEAAIYQYLTFNYVPPPQTMFDGVYHVLPGHWMRFDRYGVTTHQWWDLADAEAEEDSEANWIGRLNEVLDDAVRVRLRADVPFGAFLSGGVDSSTVVGHMSRHLSRPVNTFSIGFDDPRFDESKFAQQAADRFHTNHHLEIVDPDMFDLWPMATYHCDQPHGDVSFLPTYRVAELAAGMVKMVLTGDGADELFAGYEKYQNFFAHGSSPINQSYLEEISLFGRNTMNQVMSPEFKERMGGTDCFSEIVDPLLNRSEHMDPINQALYLDTMLLLPGNNLVKPDRMGMAASIENRSPFLDYRMVELAFAIPGNLKLRDGETKYIFKKAVEPLIGKELAYRAKQMFTVPVGTWLMTTMYQPARDLLLAGPAVDRKLFNLEFVDHMLVNHQSGAANYTREIRALMALEIWFQTFFPG